MTSERKRALITIMTTLVIGILIGALGVGLWSKQSRGGRPSASWRQSGKEAFINKIFSVVEADSVQAKQLRPIINETMTEIDSLQEQTNHQVAKVVDSLEVKLRPILTEKQMQKLKEFHSRGRKDKEAK
jgi:hypothetical protein